MDNTKTFTDFPAFTTDRLSVPLSHASRMIHLMQILGQGRGFTIENLCEIFESNARTLYRDINMIRDELHVGIKKDPRTGRLTMVNALSILPSINFTLPEALTLLLLAHEFSIRDNVPFCCPAMSAVSKIQSFLPADMNSYIEQMYPRINIVTGPSNPLGEQYQFYYQILEAIHSHSRLLLRYNSLSEEKRIKTVLDPYQLLFQRRSWFCLGPSSRHDKQIRAFNLCRITSMETLNESYVIPKSWSLRKYFRNAWNMIPGPEDYHVVIDFSKKVGNNVEEVLWHKKQKTKWMNSKSKLRFETVVSGLDEIVWWVLGYGAEATVIEPPELRTMVLSHAKQIVAKYDNESGD